VIEWEFLEKWIDVQIPPVTVVKLLSPLVAPNQQVVFAAKEGVAEHNIPSPKISPSKKVGRVLLD
jgi:hypothetical protein